MGDLTEKRLKEVVAALEEALPPIFARSAIDRLTGGLISQSTLANITSAGNDPPGFVYGARKIGFIRKEFIQWVTDNEKITNPVSWHIREKE